MPIETRSNSALFRRAEQLKRWEDSETNKVSPEIPPNKKSKIKFSDGCVFLAACAAGDTEEVERLIEQGADINTANVDGLTALHQACIDDNLDMVQFLVEHGCDVNRGDNEGWTPLHATASCGFVSIAKYLIEHGANVAAVNNDGDLPIDIAESPKMEELLSDVLDDQGIDCDEARYEEERLMLEDANQWLNSQKYEDQVHPRTGATALHVAAAKGYIKVMNVLIKAGADLNAQDNDGWTPLHAAAHWGQKEACAILADNLANMDIQNFSGQTCFDVAETDLVKLLEELKKKQASMQKERPEIQAILQRTSTRPPLKRRTSVTRMSCQEKSKSVIKDTKSERAQIEQMSLPEEEVEEEKDKEKEKDKDIERKPNESIQRLLALRQDLKRLSDAALRKSQSASTIPEKPAVVKDAQPEKIPSWKKMLRRYSDEESQAADVEVVLKKPKNSQSDEKLPENVQPSEAVEKNTESESLDKRNLSDPSYHSKENAEIANTPSSPSDPSSDSQSQGKRPYVPPTRDEESELQRKAHAKRVRETRRSTQGVLLEDLKTAELQYLMKATQDVSRTLEKERNKEKSECSEKGECELMERLSISESDPSDSKKEEECNEKSGEVDTPSSDTALADKQSDPSSPDTSPSVTLVLRTKPNSNSDEQSSPDSKASQGTQAAIQRRRRPKRRSTGVVYLDSDDALEDKESSDVEKSRVLPKDKSEDQKNETTSISEKNRNRYGSSNYPETSSEGSYKYSSLSCSKSSLNDENEKDYKKLYEELQKEVDRLQEVEKENERLKETLKKTEEELERTKKQLKKVNETSNMRNAVTEAERKSMRALERKVAEMEEEVKLVEKLRADNERLRAENGALVRVIGKVSKNKEWIASSESASAEVQ